MTTCDVPECSEAGHHFRIEIKSWSLTEGDVPEKPRVINMDLCVTHSNDLLYSIGRVILGLRESPAEAPAIVSDESDE